MEAASLASASHLWMTTKLGEDKLTKQPHKGGMKASRIEYAGPGCKEGQLALDKVRIRKENPP